MTTFTAHVGWSSMERAKYVTTVEARQQGFRAPNLLKRLPHRRLLTNEPAECRVAEAIAVDDARDRVAHTFKAPVHPRGRVIPHHPHRRLKEGPKMALGLLHLQCITTTKKR